MTQALETTLDGLLSDRHPLIVQITLALGNPRQALSTRAHQIQLPTASQRPRILDATLESEQALVQRLHMMEAGITRVFNPVFNRVVSGR
jgi:hypothetical protein